MGGLGVKRLWVQHPICGGHRPWVELRLQGDLARTLCSGGTQMPEFSGGGGRC